MKKILTNKKNSSLMIQIIPLFILYQVYHDKHFYIIAMIFENDLQIIYPIYMTLHLK